MGIYTLIDTDNVNLDDQVVPAVVQDKGPDDEGMFLSVINYLKDCYEEDQDEAEEHASKILAGLDANLFLIWKKLPEA